MGYVIFGILSIISSFGMDIIMSMRIVRDIADAGYKINIAKLEEFGELFYESNSNLYVFIPIYNFMVIFEKLIQYNNSCGMLIDQLGVLGVLEKMDIEEQEKYSINPTSLNALFININSHLKENDNINCEKKLVTSEKCSNEEYKDDMNKGCEFINNSSKDYDNYYDLYNDELSTEEEKVLSKKRTR